MCKTFLVKLKKGCVSYKLNIMDNKKKKVLLVVNPCSGRTKTRAGIDDIVNEFSDNDYEFSIHTTTCQGDATNIVKESFRITTLLYVAAATELSTKPSTV